MTSTNDLSSQEPSDFNDNNNTSIRAMSNRIEDVHIAIDLHIELKCPVCIDYSTRPRECLACGRLFCASCACHLKSCPLCRNEPFESRENRFAYRLVEEIQVKCGQCDVLVVRSRLEEHMKTCAKRLRKCSFKGCGFITSNEEEAMAHLNTAHRGQFWENFEKLPRMMSLFDTDGFTFICEENSSVLENGKALVYTVKNSQIAHSSGITMRLGEKKKDVMNFKFKPTPPECPNLQFGIIRQEDAQRNKARIFISLFMEAKSMRIPRGNGDKEEILWKNDAPNRTALPEYGVEVNTISRTIRFLISGHQVHDGDIPIPWSAYDLDDMAFFVWLYQPGDCVRIVD